MVTMARAWISNPNYGELLYQGRKEDLVPCLRCNKCHGRGKNDIMTTVCSVNPRFGFEAVEKYLVTPAGETKTVAVIGGGPGGMRSRIDEALSFYGTNPGFYMVGDCRKPGTIQTTNRSAFVTANNI